MELKERLTQIVGKEHVSDSPDVLEAYSQDYSFSPPGMPEFVVRPKTKEEILREENERLTRRCKFLIGHCGQLQERNIFLQERLHRIERLKKQSQLSHDRMNGELVRREKLIRSQERQIQELRNKLKGRR